jgi:5-methylcytosine-specific restriction endonuclease McrA
MQDNMPCDCGCGCTTDYRKCFRNKYPSGWPDHDGWYTCVECGRNNHWGNTDVDHVIPKNAGGPNCIKNLQPMCVGCNRSAQDAYGLKEIIKAQMPPGWRKLWNRHFG